MIEIKNITKKYGDTVVLKDISLTIPAGKLTALVGPNGAGKSTLLTIAARLLKAEAGTVLVDGLDVQETPDRELAKKLAVLQQDQRIASRLSVVELVRFGRFPHSQGNLSDADHLAVAKALTAMELDEYRDRFLDQLSGGQRQRAYIAMVLAQDTEYVFLDEPLNNLDMRHSLAMMRSLSSMVQELGKTVVVVLHDVNFAAAHADHVVALREGAVAANGPVHEFMTEAVLGDVYGVDVTVLDAPSQRVAVYFS